MSFDAGSIKASIDLDTVGYKGGFDEVHTHTEEGGARIREILESIAEVATEVAGPAFAQLGQEVQSAFAGFNEGAVIGSLNLIGLAAGQIREAAQGSVEELHNIGLEAEKAGVSVEFMDRMANVARTANVGLQQVGQSLKILEERAQSAADGDTKVQAEFHKLGISASRLADLLKDPQKLFEATQESIGRLTSATRRQTAAHDLLGRAGASLIPIFSLSKQQFDDLADTMDKLSGGVSDSSVETANSVFILEQEIGAAFTGIERVVSQPILKYLQNHAAEIIPEVEQLTDGLKNFITSSWGKISAAGKELEPDLQSLWRQFEAGFDSVGGLKGVVGELVKDGEGIAPAFKDGLALFADFAKIDFTVMLEAFKLAEPILEDMVKLFDELIGRAVEFIAELNKFEDAINDPKARRFEDMLPSGDRPYEATRGLSHEALKAQLDSIHDSTSPRSGPTRGLTADQAREQLIGPQSLNSLDPTIERLTEHLQGTIDAATAMQNRFEQVQPSGAGVATAFGGGGSSGAHITNVINVEAPKPAESAAEFARRVFYRVQKAQRDYRAGDAMLATAQSGMGGIG